MTCFMIIYQITEVFRYSEFCLIVYFFITGLHNLKVNKLVPRILSYEISLMLTSVTLDLVILSLSLHKI